VQCLKASFAELLEAAGRREGASGEAPPAGRAPKVVSLR
jgi:hypothetical protein